MRVLRDRRPPLLVLGTLVLTVAMPLVLTSASPVSAGSVVRSAPAPGAYEPAEAVAEVRLPGGDIQRTIWHAAPGITEEQFHSALLAEGVPGLLNPAVAAAADCPIGGAYAWRRFCGINQVHWSGSHPTIYFIDYSGSNWPVYEAAVVWNQSTALNVGYRSPATGCPGGHCVNVRSDWYDGPCLLDFSAWIGCTTLTFNETTRLINDGGVGIKLNDKYAGSYSYNQVITCHELGHALGLDHNIYTDSCLYSIHSGTRYPNTGDFQMLEYIY